MSKIRKIVKNLLINFSSALIISISQFIFNVIVARYFGSAKYGFISYAISYIFLFTTFNDFGLSTISVRNVAKEEKNAGKYLSSVFTFRAILSLLIIIIALAIIPLLQSDPIQRSSLILFTISGFFFMLSLSYRWIFQAFQVFEYEAMLNITQAALVLMTAFLVVFFKKGLMALAYGWVLTYVSIFLLGLIFALNIARDFRFRLDIDLIKKLIVPALPVGLIAIFSVFYANIDKILLFQMKGGLEVGWYSAAGKFVLFLKGLTMLYMPVIFPALANFSIENKPYFDKLLKKSFNYILMSTLAASLGAVILARPIIMLVFGHGFEQSVLSLQIIMWAIPFMSLSALLINAFISVARQKESFIIVALGLVFNVVFNIIFIPFYGYIATSYAVLFSEILMFSILLYHSYKLMNFRISLIKVSRIGLSLIVMGIFTFWFSFANLFLNIILSMLVYFLALVALKGIDADDWNLLKKVYLRQI